MTKGLNQELHINERYGVISVEETSVKIFHPECAEIAIKCVDLMNVTWLIKHRRKMVRVAIKNFLITVKTELHRTFFELLLLYIHTSD